MKKRFEKKHLILPSALLLSCMLGAAGFAEESQDAAISLVTDIPTTQYFTEEAVAEADIETILLAGVNAPSAMNGQKWHFSVVTDPEVLEQIAGDMGGGMGFGGGTPPAGFSPDGAGMPEGMEMPEGGEMPAMPEGAEMPAMPEGVEMPDGAEMPAMPEGTEIPEGTEMPEGAEGFAAPAMPAGGSGASKAGIADAPLAIIVSGASESELDAGLACQNMSVTAQLLGYGSKIISSPTMALNGTNQETYKELLGIPAEYAAVAVLLVGYEDTSVDETVDGYTGATERNPLDTMVTYVTP